MGISGVSYQNLYNTNHQQVCKKSDNFKDIISTQCKNQEYGEILGLAMIPEPNTNVSWGMASTYAEGSTLENPIIHVETNYGGKTSAYNIRINDIDPSNASRLEIFALSSYADDQGVGDKSTFGTYQTLKTYEDMSIRNGYFGRGAEEANTLEQFQNVKLNWNSACKKMLGLLYKCNDLEQYIKGRDIMNLFSKYPSN